ncbi:MAG: type II toxin-antitoxin system RelB/DinJ family antitoxin [Lactobacillus sp.]
MTTASMNFKTDQSNKEEFNKVAEKLGTTSSALLNMYVARVVREQGIPFKVEVIPDRKNDVLDEESKTEMIRELAIEKGLIPDSDHEVKDIDEYFKKLGM